MAETSLDLVETLVEFLVAKRGSKIEKKAVIVVVDQVEIVDVGKDLANKKEFLRKRFPAVEPFTRIPCIKFSPIVRQ